MNFLTLIFIVILMIIFLKLLRFIIKKILFVEEETYKISLPLKKEDIPFLTDDEFENFSAELLTNSKNILEVEKNNSLYNDDIHLILTKFNGYRVFVNCNTCELNKKITKSNINNLLGIMSEHNIFDGVIITPNNLDPSCIPLLDAIKKTDNYNINVIDYNSILKLLKEKTTSFDVEITI